MTNNNTSATGGPLAPALPLPTDDVALDEVFQSLVTNITGLTIVVPRWQPDIPKQPEPQVNWCAIGITVIDPDAGPWIVYDAVNNVENFWDHEELEVLASFYGPNAQGFARLLRNGLEVPQNTEQLLGAGVRYLYSSSQRSVPELINQQWIRRHDIPLYFRRKIVLTYPIENFLYGEVVLRDDTIVNDTIVVPPGVTLAP